MLWNISSSDKVSEKLEELKGRRGDEMEASFQQKMNELTFTAQEHGRKGNEAQEEFQDFDKGETNKKNWWKRFVKIRKDMKFARLL